MIFEFSSFGDTKYFVFSLMLGVFLGVVYDVFRLVRIVLPKNNTVIFFEDIIFCLFATFSFLLLAFNFGSGRIRGFAAAGTVVGFSLYYSTLGKLVYKANERIISFIKRIIKCLLKAIKKPFVLAFGWMIKKVRKAKQNYKRKKLIKNAIKKVGKGFGLEEKYNESL